MSFLLFERAGAAQERPRKLSRPATRASCEPTHDIGLDNALNHGYPRPLTPGGISLAHSVAMRAPASAQPPLPTRGLPSLLADGLRGHQLGRSPTPPTTAYGRRSEKVCPMERDVPTSRQGPPPSAGPAAAAQQIWVDDILGLPVDADATAGRDRRQSRLPAQPGSSFGPRGLPVRAVQAPARAAVSCDGRGAQRANGGPAAGSVLARPPFGGGRAGPRPALAGAAMPRLLSVRALLQRR